MKVMYVSDNRLSFTKEGPWMANRTVGSLPMQESTTFGTAFMYNNCEHPKYSYSYWEMDFDLTH